MALLVLLATLGSGCSRVATKTQAISASPQVIVIRGSYTPTPIPQATARYSNFVYHFRRVGDTRFIDVPSSSVVPTPDGSVLAKFEVKTAPLLNQKYESYISYRLDGTLVQTAQPTEAWVTNP